MSFTAALQQRAREAGLSLAKVAELSGVSYEQLKKAVQRGASTNVDDALRVAHCLGMTLEEFIQDDFPADRDEIRLLLAGLSDKERHLLRASAQAFAARDQSVAR